jgi:hypothetical protein
LRAVSPGERFSREVARQDFQLRNLGRFDFRLDPALLAHFDKVSEETEAGDVRDRVDGVDLRNLGADAVEFTREAAYGA